MAIWQKEFVGRLKNNAARKVSAVQERMPFPGVDKFQSELSDVRSRLGDSTMEQLLLRYEGPIVHKWLHYLPLYDCHLSQYRQGSVSILEIGVFREDR